MKISIIIPAKNEAKSLRVLLPKLKSCQPSAEIVLVNDGSTDETSDLCEKNNVVEVKHLYSKGNGAAIKAGARVAKGDVFVFMDADGQHNPDDIERLINKYHQGYDLVVGSRSSDSQASLGRLAANKIYNYIASWMVEVDVKDLTSGFRVVDASKFKEFIYLLPNGFSYPTTSTMAFFRAGYSVCYEPIIAAKREGDSHINIAKDGVRFLLIIFKVGTLYAPLKIFSLISACLFLSGLSYYAYTYFVYSRFTNMGVLLVLAAIFVFLIGLISEQISTLFYKK